MSDNETPPVYPVDGSPSLVPDPKAWAEHSDEQVQTNLSGMAVAREALKRGNIDSQTPDVAVADDLQTEDDQLPEDE